MQTAEMIRTFSNRFSCGLTVLDDAEHFFHTEQQLALPVQAGAPHKTEPARHHKKQVAVQKGVLSTEDQPRDGIQVKHRRPPGGKTADLGMRLIKAKIALRRAVGHDCRKLLDVVDLVAPRAGGQVDLAKRHAVDEPLMHQ